MSPVRTKSLLKSLVNSVIILFLLISFFSGIDQDPGESTKSHLNIIIGGIRDKASNTWFGSVNSIAPTKDRYVIISDPAMFNNVPPSVPKENIILYKPGDKVAEQKLREIGSNRNASVFIDMDLGLSDVSLIPVGKIGPFKRKWIRETDWAANAAVLLAGTHKKLNANSEVLLFGHSAGTEAVAKAQKIQYQNIQNKDAHRKIFDRSVAASPRDVTAFLDKSTIFIVSNGDFIQSPDGIAKISDLFRNKSEALLRAGYIVVRITTPGVTNFTPDIFEKHSLTTDYTQPGMEIDLYAPTNTEPVHISGINTGNIIKKLIPEKEIKRETLLRVAEEIEKEKPTKNIGGISLNASAELPIELELIQEALYNSSSNKLSLILKNGQIIDFPQMKAELIKLAYDNCYIKDLKQELSIGSVPEKKDIPHSIPQGMLPVYYLGGIENTEIGLALLNADIALGKLSFASSPEVFSVSKRIPGFHSLPELFPAKYLDNPLQYRFLGNVTVVLNSDKIELDLDNNKNQFFFKQTSFRIEMPNVGAAESYFCSFFNTNINKILQTEEAKPIMDLIPLANVVGIFKWLRNSKIKLRGDFENIAIENQSTPAFTPFPKIYKIQESDFYPKLPVILFCEYGPSTIYFDANRTVKFTYSKGLLKKISSYTGKELRLYYDDLGNPIAYNIDQKLGGAFCIDNNLGPVFINNIIYDEKNSRITTTAESVLRIDNRPVPTFQKIISDFINNNR